MGVALAVRLGFTVRQIAAGRKVLPSGTCTHVRSHVPDTRTSPLQHDCQFRITVFQSLGARRQATIHNT